MLHISLFDLPVYRCSRDKYETDKQTYIEKYLYAYPKDSNLYKDHSIQFGRMYGGEWKYNEIIGFIGLHIMGSQIRGEYWQVRAKRIVKTRKKQFEWKTHKLAPETSLHHCKTNSEILNEIFKYVEECKKELPKRYIDDSQLYNIGSYINWKKLIK